MKVSDIIKCTNGTLLSGDMEYFVDGFSIDSRTINNCDIFIAIKGDKFDGNKFVNDILNSDSVGVIFDGNLNINLNKYNNKIIIKVKDSLKALQSMAKYKRSLYDIPVVAITGSVGKTSTKDIVASVMSLKYNVLKTEGNHNNHIGLPLTLLKLKNHNAMCIEMGMNHFGEISLLTDILKPTIAVITNIGTAHIGNLGSRENILKAKMEILEGLEDKGVVIINNDDDLLNKWNINNNKYNVITYGINNNSDYMGTFIEENINSSSFKLNNKNDIYVPVAGRHFIYNSLCAISVGKVLNIDTEDIVTGIKNFHLSKSRMENIDLNNGIRIISDCYNANYDSMKASLEILGKYKTRKIAVLGDMLELGEYSRSLHSKIGYLVDKNNIDILICVGNLSKNIYDNTTINDKYLCNDNNEAENILDSIIKQDDVILFKASNSMKFIDIVNYFVNKYKKY